MKKPGLETKQANVCIQASFATTNYVKSPFISIATKITFAYSRLLYRNYAILANNLTRHYIAACSFFNGENVHDICYAKQKHLGCKKVRGQSVATLHRQARPKRFNISLGQEVTLSNINIL